MKKQIYALILIGLMVFITGCESDDDETLEKAYLGGSQAIVASFNTIGAENEITQDDRFSIEIDLKNQGEFDIDEDKINVYLDNVPDFKGISSTTLTNPDPLFKRTKNFDGGETTISFSESAYYDLIITGAFRDINLYATVCYPYRTVIEAKACYNTDLKDDSICKPNQDNVEFEVSGAPLQVTGIQQVRESSNRIALYFDIENQGNGKSSLACRNLKSENKLNFEMEDDDWDCRYGGSTTEAKLVNNKQRIKCTKEIDSDDNFERSELLYLNYYYSTTIKQDLKIYKSE